MGLSKPFVLLRTLLKHSFVSNFFSKGKARVFTQFLGTFLVLLGCPVREYSAPKALMITGLGACACLIVL